MNILITGANGYLAKNFIKEIFKIEKYNLTLLVRKDSNVKDLLKYVDIKNIIFYDETIDSLKSLQKYKINLVLHLANYYPDSTRPDIPEKIISSNLTLIANITNILGNKDSFKIINISSNAAEYDSSLYGLTKLTAEKYLEENYLCSTFRLHDTYGEKDPRQKLINQLINYSNSGKVLEIKSAPEKLIHIIYIKDVISAFFSIIENSSPMNNNNYLKSHSLKHIFSETMTLKDVVKTFNDISLKKVNILWRVKNSIKMPLQSPGELPDGWKPKYNLSQGLKEILRL